MNSKKKVLTGAAIVTAVAGTTIATINKTAKADSVSTTTQSTTSLQQAQQNVNNQKQVVQQAQKDDNNAANVVNDAQNIFNNAKDTVQETKQAIQQGEQKVVDTNNAVKNAQNQLTVANENLHAIKDNQANSEQLKADLSQAKQEQHKLTNQNINNQLQNEISQAQKDNDIAKTNQNNAQQDLTRAQTNLVQAQEKLKDANDSTRKISQDDINKAQLAVNQAKKEKNIADQNILTDKSNISTADSKVIAAKNSQNIAHNAFKQAQRTVDQKKDELSKAQIALNNAKKSGQTEVHHATKSIKDILWIPSNFKEVMGHVSDDQWKQLQSEFPNKSMDEIAQDMSTPFKDAADMMAHANAFTEGVPLSKEQQQMLNDLFINNKHAFLGNMYDIMSDDDYDLTYDLSDLTYNHTDLQGKGTNLEAELENFTAQVINGFREALGETNLNHGANLKFDEFFNGGTQDYGLHIPKGSSQADAWFDFLGAYPIEGKPYEYSLDQLKLALFTGPILFTMFHDYGTDLNNPQIKTQGDHACTMLGHRGGINNDNGRTYFYIKMMPNPNPEVSNAKTKTILLPYTVQDEDVSILKNADYVSKVDQISVNTPLDITSLQNAVNSAQEALKKETEVLNDKTTVKNTADQMYQKVVTIAKNAQQKLNIDQIKASEAAKNLNQVQDNLKQLQQAYKDNNNDQQIAVLKKNVEDAQLKVEKAQIVLRDATDKVNQSSEKLKEKQVKFNEWEKNKVTADQRVINLEKILENTNNDVLTKAQTAVEKAQKQLLAVQTQLKEVQEKQCTYEQNLIIANNNLEKARAKLDEAKRQKDQTANALNNAQIALNNAQIELDRIKTTSHDNKQNFNQTDANRYAGQVVIDDTNIDTGATNVPSPVISNPLIPQKLVTLPDNQIVSLYSPTGDSLVALPVGTTATWLNKKQIIRDAQNIGSYFEDVLVNFTDSSTIIVKAKVNVKNVANTDSSYPFHNGTQSAPTQHLELTHDENEKVASDSKVSVQNTGRKFESSAVNHDNGIMASATPTKQLPQTGSTNSSSLLALGLVTLIGMFGLGFRKRNL